MAARQRRCRIRGVQLLLGIAVAALGVTGGTAAAEPRSSILLLVLDTVRADAVSAYGSSTATTPTIDGLAEAGLRYDRAWAPSPWTLPSHATLLTGLRADEHRVGLPGQGVLSKEVRTLAERLTEQGYQSAAFSENPIVSDAFQLLRGFDHRRFRTLDTELASTFEFDIVGEIRRWLETRDPKRPDFVFVNLFGAHSPYEIRASNRFVPSGTPPEAIRRRSNDPQRLLCGGLPPKQDIEVQRGLYLGDVAVVDETVGKILELLKPEAGPGGRIIVVTSDHGEMFGEARLMGHEFSLHGALLRVPLIVHGLPGVEPGVIDEGVGLVDLAPSILRWAGAEPPDGLSGVPLGSIAAGAKRGGPAERAFFAAYSDTLKHSPPDWERDGTAPQSLDEVRQFCSPSDPVYGGMASLTRFPYKYRWYERYPAELYDLSWDTGERSNQAKHRPELVESFRSEMESYLESAALGGSAGGVPKTGAQGLTPDQVEALRELGYLE